MEDAGTQHAGQRPEAAPKISGKSVRRRESPRVSVVIPVYNVERYLRECLDSIVGQTLRDMEIICVDDGSTDGSAAILAEYAAKDSRIRVLSQTNRGLSSARNKGMARARGEYLYFIDSDDWIEANALENLVRIADGEKLDQLIFSAHVFCDEDYDGRISNQDRENKEKYCCILPQLAHRLLPGADLLRLLQERRNFNVLVYQRLYRLSALKSCGARFPVGILHEDEYFAPVTLVHAARAMAISDRFYHRRLRAGSITTSTDKLTHRLQSCISIARLLTAYAEKHWPDRAKEKAALLSRCDNIEAAIRNLGERIPLEELPNGCKNALILAYRKSCILSMKDRKSELEKYDTWIKEKKDKLSKYDEWLAKKTAQIRLLEEKLSGKTAQLDELRRELKGKDARIALLSAAISEKDARLERLGKRTDDGSAVIDRLNSKPKSSGSRQVRAKAKTDSLSKKGR